MGRKICLRGMARVIAVSHGRQPTRVQQMCSCPYHAEQADSFLQAKVEFGFIGFRIHLCSSDIFPSSSEISFALFFHIYVGFGIFEIEFIEIKIALRRMQIIRVTFDKR